MARFAAMSGVRFLSIAEQVAAHLRDGLLQGRWQGSMPGLPRLARELGIDPKTVAVALGQLERQGLLERQGWLLGICFLCEGR